MSLPTSFVDFDRCALLALGLVLLMGSYGCAPPPAANPSGSGATTGQRLPVPAGDDIRSLAADSEGHLYAGTLGGLYRWEPDSSLWRFLPSSEPADVLAVSDTALYAGSWSGTELHRVEQAGEDWSDIREGLFDLMNGQGSPFRLLADDSTLYLTTGKSFVRSRDAGLTWEHVLDEDDVPLRAPISGPPRPHVQGFRDALQRGPDGTLYVGLRTPDTSNAMQPRIFQSHDGDAWTEVLPAPPEDPDYLVATSDGLTLQSMVDVEGEFRVTYRQFQLAPGADAWTEVALPDSLLQHLAVAGDELYVYGQWRGFYRQQPSGGFEALDLPAAVNTVIEHHGRLYAGTNRGVFVSEDGYTWIPMNRGQRVDPDHIVEAETGTWAWDDYESTYYRSDGEQAWEARYRGLPPRPSIRGLAVEADGTAWLLVSREGLYRWDSSRWHLADSSMAMRRAYANSGSALVRSARGTLFSGAIIMANHEEKAASVLHRRVGDSFQPVTELPGLPAPDSTRRLAVDELTARPDGTLIARIKADDTLYRYRSDDDGVTWTPFEAPEPD